MIYFSKKIKGLCPNKVPNVIQIFMDAYNLGNRNGLVSRLYRSTVTMNKDETNYAKQRRVKGLNIVITEEEWLHTWKTSSSTSSHTWRDFCWKNQTHFFITPKQKSKQIGTRLLLQSTEVSDQHTSCDSLVKCFVNVPLEGRPKGRSRTCWTDYVSELAWEHPNELEKVSGERGGLSASLLRLRPPSPRYRTWKMVGWMDGYRKYSYICVYRRF